MLDFQKIFRCYILPGLVNSQLAFVGIYCLLIYHSEVSQKEIKLPSFAYSLMIANSLAGLTKFVPDDSFYELRLLLDYAQLIMALPLITTEFLITHQIFPEEISGIPVYIGFTALMLFIIFEYKRQDLTDLTIILSLFLYASTGIFHQPMAIVGSIFFSVGYFSYKRNEGVCLRNQNYFNLCMAVFGFLSVVAFEPEKLLSIPSDMSLL
ncbi:uncharacterized protein [Leptinotarsa decemlineata]|uniref:uncharacterized protein n=1 Tax=Leptinotarsa decemlineata TaxID=7539 RepID=UPI000C25441E|nr:uncharacterized protein LOC111505760 [Leptinotarsa decemlineata]